MEERAGVRRHVLPRQGTTWADLLHTTAGIENKGANTHDKTKQLEARAGHTKRESLVTVRTPLPRAANTIITPVFPYFFSPQRGNRVTPKSVT